MIRDLLIIGQGLAGSCVAWESLKAGLDFEVVSDPALDTQAASRVAGGSCHPISGQRFTPLWRGMEFFGAADSLYREIEEAIERKIWRPIPTAFIFEGGASRVLWEKRAESFAEQKIPTEALPDPLMTRGLRREAGGAASSVGGALDLSALMDGVRTHLQGMGRWRSGRVDLRALKWDSQSGQVQVMEERVRAYRQVVVCMGRFILELEDWNTRAPWGSTKGETLEVEIQGIGQDRIWRRGMALIPQGGSRFRLSATFERNSLDEAPSFQGREQLNAALEGALEPELMESIRPLAHQAGVRVHVRDYLPVVGEWPNLPGIAVLNGLGSKGVLWAPLCAQWLVRSIAAHDPSLIPAEVRAARFKGGKI